MTEFVELDADGTVLSTRTIPRQAMLQCPHFIMVPEHYRDDNTCRCNDPGALEMKEWGYTWDGQRWR